MKKLTQKRLKKLFKEWKRAINRAHGHEAKLVACRQMKRKLRGYKKPDSRPDLTAFARFLGEIELLDGNCLEQLGSPAQALKSLVKARRHMQVHRDLMRRDIDRWLEFCGSTSVAVYCHEGNALAGLGQIEAALVRYREALDLALKVRELHHDSDVWLRGEGNLLFQVWSNLGLRSAAAR